MSWFLLSSDSDVLRKGRDCFFVFRYQAFPILLSFRCFLCTAVLLVSEIRSGCTSLVVASRRDRLHFLFVDTDSPTSVALRKSWHPTCSFQPERRADEDCRVIRSYSLKSGERNVRLRFRFRNCRCCCRVHMLNSVFLSYFLFFLFFDIWFGTASCRIGC